MPKTDLLIIDLEATCWRDKALEPPIIGAADIVNETIEIGAVLVGFDDFKIKKTYQSFVRPTSYPVLTDFCCELTHISQSDVDAADVFPAAFAKFSNEFGLSGGDGDPIFCSWGFYDKRQFLSDCRLHKSDYPFSDSNYVNIKKIVTGVLKSKKRGLSSVVSRIGLPFEGSHHRALDDAINICRILQSMSASQAKDVRDRIIRTRNGEIVNHKNVFGK